MSEVKHTQPPKKTAIQILMESPDEQVTRMKIVVREIASGNWREAWFHLSNIGTGPNEWLNDVGALSDFCLEAARQNDAASAAIAKAKCEA